jgi:hypothetical protein
VRLRIAQRTRRRRSRQRNPGGGIHHTQSFANQIKGAPDLTMPETPTNPFDGLGEASVGLAITLRRVGPVLGHLGGMLHPHRKIEHDRSARNWPIRRVIADLWHHHAE